MIIDDIVGASLNLNKQALVADFAVEKSGAVDAGWMGHLRINKFVASGKEPQNARAKKRAVADMVGFKRGCHP